MLSPLRQTHSHAWGWSAQRHRYIRGLHPESAVLTDGVGTKLSVLQGADRAQDGDGLLLRCGVRAVPVASKGFPVGGSVSVKYPGRFPLVPVMP